MKIHIEQVKYYIKLLKKNRCVSSSRCSLTVPHLLEPTGHITLKLLSVHVILKPYKIWTVLKPNMKMSVSYIRCSSTVPLLFGANRSYDLEAIELEKFIGIWSIVSRSCDLLAPNQYGTVRLHLLYETHLYFSSHFIFLPILYDFLKHLKLNSFHIMWNGRATPAVWDTPFYQLLILSLFYVT